jgi:threonylcarbamoyladenosine tRNA methylthiotransferase MtaB
MFRVSFHTLGCKLNQLETESIARAFTREGFEIVPWGGSADLYVVNTCTVTSMAEQKARREIRKVLRDRPSACVIATGCYAQLDGEALAAVADSIGLPIERRHIVVVSGDLKSSLLDLPSYIADSACASADLPQTLASWAASRVPGGDRSVERFRFDADDFSFHSRASLKIQDGCDNLCAYCRVRIARGPSVSLDSATVLARLRELEANGYAEAVLTGVNVSRYRDAAGRDFPALLRELLCGTERIRLRISSTEPDSVDDDFCDAVAHPRVRPHFHLSVQSGSDAILSSMRRRYRAERVLEAARLLRERTGDPFLACDIIAGFPGESEADFEATLALCRTIDFAWIHAFPYSPRPGTEAADFSGRVPERESALRVNALLDLACEGRERFVDRNIGREVEAVAESGPTTSDGAFPAVSDAYLKLAVFAPAGVRPRPGEAFRCRIGESLLDQPHAAYDARAELLEILF